MGKGYKHGSSGAGLNYRLVGGTAAPESPRENTIWIHTDTLITDHVFSSAAPEGSQGRVWIRTGLSSDVPFNPLKKNTILIAPVSARLYTNGEWSAMDADIYQAGSWKALWGGLLFDAGNQYEDITGGWTDIEAGAAVIYRYASAKQDYGISVNSRTRKEVDLTSYSKLTATVDSYSGQFTVSVVDSAGSRIASVSAQAAGTVSLDISEISGSYCIDLYAYGHDQGTEGNSYATAAFTVSQVALV